MRVVHLSVALAALLGTATASVSVKYTGQPPTGYEVTFRYANASAHQVQIAGGLLPFTDQFHTTPAFSAAYDPHDYRPGDFFVANLNVNTTGNLGPQGTYSGFYMNDTGHGEWEWTAPFPSGTYSYAYIIDCDLGPRCAGTEPGQVPGLTFYNDPENPPFQNDVLQFNHSIFQVPYDREYQYYPALNLDFDFALPVPAGHQGKALAVNYSSPGSTYPAKDVHDLALYLPPSYDANCSTPYPVLYLSHGGGGTAFDWPNLAKAFNIIDNLIHDHWIPPTIVVCPAFYNLGCNDTGPTPDLMICVRENYLRILLPFIESTYRASSDPDHRAFAGLSLGSELTYEMYINATTNFTYFGHFSGARGPAASDTDTEGYISNATVAANPALADRGVFVGFGNFDIAFSDCRSLELALELAGVGFLSRKPTSKMATTTTDNMEMQYKPAEPMQASPSNNAQEHAHTSDCEAQQPKKERTFLGMRGGGLIRTLPPLPFHAFFRRGGEGDKDVDMLGCGSVLMNT
ncbi:hypothetical protein B0A55_08525 [Friedmanniomyces simplex]|uniref:Carbohydrate esterase family 1 protein n=1 Tax=Friedmanniomyces simplex TaxID=329884 RepID=A0A4U0WYE6_9PEZI|nr:hypothetical protein B0A55_08525 [Friedmanniomyces simplex]